MTSVSEISTLKELINGRKIEIPTIQRPYAWSVGDTHKKKPQDVAVTALIEDLMFYHDQVANGASHDYFMGQLIVYVPDGDVKDKKATWQLLDGQQRITTFSLLFNEIYKKIQFYDEDGIDGVNEAITTIRHKILRLNKEIFESPDVDWVWALYPRREIDRRIYDDLMRHEEFTDIKDSLLKDAAEKFSKDLEKLSLDFILDLSKTLLERVVFSIIVTDDVTMGFQMFQTANARGTELTMLDQFRSTILTKCETKLDLTKAEKKQVIQELDDIEVGFKIASPKIGDKREEEKVTKYIFTSWISSRSGTLQSQTRITPYITMEIDGCPDFRSIEMLLRDLRKFCTSYRMLIGAGGNKGLSEILPSYTYQPIFGLIKEQWKLLAVNAWRAEHLADCKPKLNSDNIEAILKMQVWWILWNGAMNSNSSGFASWATEAHMLWEHDRDPDVVTTSWNKKTYRERRKVRLDDISFKGLQTVGALIDKKVLTGFDEKYANRARAILSMFELQSYSYLGLEGFEHVINKAGTQQFRIMPLFTKSEVGQDQYIRIGNWFLVRGKANEGLTKDAIKNLIREDTTESRINAVREYASEVSKYDIPDYSEGPFVWKQFITKRSGQIRDVIRDAFDDFRRYKWIEDDLEEPVHPEMVETETTVSGSSSFRMKITDSMLTKANIDATKVFQDHMREWGVVNYHDIPKGSENKVIKSINLYVNNIKKIKNISFYKTNNRGPRFWIEQLNKEDLKGGEYLEFSLGKDRILIVSSNSTIYEKHGTSWSEEELEYVVKMYIEYVKNLDKISVERPDLEKYYKRLSMQGPTNGRSPNSIKFKFQNITKIMIRMESGFISQVIPVKEKNKEIADKLRYFINKHNTRK